MDSLVSTVSGSATITVAYAALVNGNLVVVDPVGNDILAIQSLGSGIVDVTRNGINLGSFTLGSGGNVQVETLAGNDTIRFTGPAISMSISGGSNDTLDLSGTTTSNTWTFSGNSTTVNGVTTNSLIGTVGTITFGSVSQVIGNGNDTLVGPALNNTWTLSGSDSGTFSDTDGSITFSGIANLVAGGDADVFEVGNGSLTGSINGGAVGSTLNYSTTTGAVQVVVTRLINGQASGAATSLAYGFSNINQFVGGATTNLLTGPGTPDWTLTGTDAGTLDNEVGSTNFAVTPDVPTSVVLSLSTIDAAAGQTERVTATVSSLAGNGVPTGTVQFQVNGFNYVNPVPLQNGAATMTYIVPSTGAYDFVALYTDDPTFAASTSAVLTVLPTWTVNQAYNQTISLSTLFDANSFTVSSGSLPPGLSLNSSTGAITGTPTTASGSPFSFTVAAADANGNTASQAYTVTINPALTMTPADLPTASVGSDYSQTLTVSGGTTPYKTFTVTGFNAGTTSLNSSFVTINANAGTITLSGIPSATGSVSFTVDVSDSTGATLTTNYTLAVFGIQSAVASPDGVVLTFNAPIDPATTVLYSSPGDTTLGPADITVVGATTGTVRGSLVIDPTILMSLRSSRPAVCWLLTPTL